MKIPPHITEEGLWQCVHAALREDIGEGDVSTLGTVPRGLAGKARILTKERGIIAGVALAEKIFAQHDKDLTISVYKNDGEAASAGDTVLIVEGKFQSILSTERLVLNCMQRMSGIATRTRCLCELLEGTATRLKDTRKTTPNFRMMEKWAVALGGGVNHRMGLYDMVLIKDTHVDIAGGIKKAIDRMNVYLREEKKNLKIEIEVRNLNELNEVLDTGKIDTIMLDNMSLPDMRKAVAMVNNTFLTEASGTITEETLRQVAECGVDYVSMGSLTHSVVSLDMSLKVIK